MAVWCSATQADQVVVFGTAVDCVYCDHQFSGASKKVSHCESGFHSCDQLTLMMAYTDINQSLTTLPSIKPPYPLPSEQN